MLHGNWRLHGWSMVADNYWTADVAMGGVLSGLRWLLGLPVVSAATLVWQPAISWTLATLTAVFLAQRGLPSVRQRWFAGLIVLAAFGVPVMRPGTATTLVLLSGIHILTIVYALLALAFGGMALVEERWKLPLAGMSLCLVLGVIGDPLMLFICVAPLLTAVAVLRGRRMLIVGAASIGATLIAKLILLANAAANGFTLAELPFEFAKFEDLGWNAGAALHGFMAVFSADFTGQQVASAVPQLLHLPLMLLTIGAVVLTIKQPWSEHTGPNLEATNFLVVGLALGAAVDIAALWLSRRVEYENGSFATARYLFPAWVFGSIVLARHANLLNASSLLSVPALLSALSYNHYHTAQTPAPALNGNEYALLNALQAQQVRTGLAGYWQAALMQVASGNRLRVGACIANEAGRLIPLRNANRMFSLADVTTHDFFVVVLNRPTDFDAPAVIRSFGQPDRIKVVSDYTVMFYHGMGPVRT